MYLRQVDPGSFHSRSSLYRASKDYAVGLLSTTIYNYIIPQYIHSADWNYVYHYDGHRDEVQDLATASLSIHQYIPFYSLSPSDLLALALCLLQAQTKSRL